MMLTSAVASSMMIIHFVGGVRQKGKIIMKKNEAAALAEKLTDVQVDILSALGSAGAKGLNAKEAELDGRAVGGLKRRGLVEETKTGNVRLTAEGKAVSKVAA